MKGEPLVLLHTAILTWKVWQKAIAAAVYGSANRITLSRSTIWTSAILPEIPAAFPANIFIQIFCVVLLFPEDMWPSLDKSIRTQIRIIGDLAAYRYCTSLVFFFWRLIHVRGATFVHFGLHLLVKPFPRLIQCQLCVVLRGPGRSNNSCSPAFQRRARSFLGKMVSRQMQRARMDDLDVIFEVNAVMIVSDFGPLGGWEDIGWSGR